MVDLEKIIALAKRRGFIFPSSEIYGGLAGFYDWGPLGQELKFNIKQLWWQKIVKEREEVVGISTSIILNSKVWAASGHLSGFSDALVECPFCHKRFKAEELKKKDNDFICLECQRTFQTEVRNFNLMFKTYVGAVEDLATVAYLRPETAGGIFINFKNVLQTTRLKIPFGIAQIGRAFRNEINPRDFVFRTREFEQMELEYFVKPEQADDFFNYWVEQREKWYHFLGLKKIQLNEQKPEERAHYSRRTIDIEYEFPFGFGEIEGIANRGDFDLKAHQEFSGKDLGYFDEDKKETYLPYVIEPSAGVERIALAVLCEAYAEEGERVILKLPPKLAPYKVAVFPLLANKEPLIKLARSVFNDLKKEFMVVWDERGNIGKRYYAQDEIGTPFCVTIDFESLEKNDVTVRFRDSMKQVRVKIKVLKDYLKQEIEKD